MPDWLTIELGVLAVAVPLVLAYGGYLRHEFRALKEKDEALQREVADMRVEIERRSSREAVSQLHTKIDGVASKVDRICGKLDVT